MKPARCARAWDGFWFSPSSARDLACTRIAFHGGLFAYYLPSDFALWADVAPLHWRPVWVLSSVGLGVPQEPVLAALSWSWKVALACACVGLATRVATLWSFVLGLYLLAIPNSTCRSYHYDAVLVLMLGSLALSRAGDALSVDRVLRARRGGVAGPAALRSGEYTWPVRLCWLCLTSMFFAAGVAKLRESGLGWADPAHLRSILIRSYYRESEMEPVGRLGLWVATQPWLCGLIGVMTLVIEAGYPLALVDRRLRFAFVCGSLALLSGIRVLMGPTFTAVMIAHVVWIPWNRLHDALIARRSRARSVDRPC